MEVKAETGPVPNCLGAYALHHEPSGLLLVGHCTDLARTKQSHWDHLAAGVHQNTMLQQLYDQQPVLMFEFYPTPSRQAAEQIARELVQQHELSGRLIDPGRRYLLPADHRPPTHYNA
jgi:hypothetical protein